MTRLKSAFCNYVMVVLQESGLHIGFFHGGGPNFFIAGETLWLIDHSEGEGVGGDVPPPPMLHAAQKLILFLTVRFTLWTNKGNAIISATGTATFYLKKKSARGGDFFWVGKIPGPPPPLYEALI